MARTIAKDYDEKRGHILKAAARVFAEQGYDRASMSVLAKECGISKANIYHYYGSKDAILYDILDTYLGNLRNRICGMDLEGVDAKERFSRVVREILRAYEGADNDHKVQLNTLGALPVDQQVVLKGYQRDLVRFLGDIIADVAPERLAQDETRLRAITMSVFGMLNWYYMWNQNAGPDARDTYAQLVADMVQDGVNGLA